MVGYTHPSNCRTIINSVNKFLARLFFSNGRDMSNYKVMDAPAYLGDMQKCRDATRFFFCRKTT